MERIPYSTSLRILQDRISLLTPRSEIIPTRSANGRVLASPVYAWRSNPSGTLAAMDGIAVNSRNAASVPVLLLPDNWQRINTGDVVPERFDAVIKIEDVIWQGDSPRLEKSVVPFQNIRAQGEDFRSGTLLLPRNICLQAQDLSLLLAGGHEEIEVYCKPLVVFVPTGSELVLHASDPPNGKSLESNSAMIAGMVQEWGGDFLLTEPVEDDRKALETRIQEWTSQADVLVISAGTSMGSRDLTSSVLQELGKVYFHGVALHPAKPVILADVSAVPVIGLPGYPAAAYVASYLYLRPVVLALSNLEWKRKQDVMISPEELPAKETDYFYRVHLYDVDGRTYAKRIIRGAGSVMSLSQMDALMHIPPNLEIHKRDGVRVDIVNDRWQNSFAVQGAEDPNVMRLFELFHLTLPSHRMLFWESTAKDALQSMMERNAHMAVICSDDESDPFPQYASQLQEPMLRHRLFTRNSCQHFDLIVLESHTELPAIQRLIDLIYSEDYTRYILSQEGCEVSDRGLVEPRFPLDT